MIIMMIMMMMVINIIIILIVMMTMTNSHGSIFREIVVFLKKFAAAAIPIYFSSSKITQSVMSMFAYFIYLLAIFKVYPLATLKLNQVSSRCSPQEALNAPLTLLLDVSKANVSD